MRALLLFGCLAGSALAQPGRGTGSATLLADGRVLLSGLEDDAGVPAHSATVPVWSGFTPVLPGPPMQVPRRGAITVHEFGGGARAYFGETAGGPSGVVEAFDPDGGWSIVGAHAPRADACWATLRDGTLVIAGGRGATGPLLDALVFSAAGELLRTVPLPGPAVGCRAAVDAQRRVLVVGGRAGDGGLLASVWRFEPRAGAVIPGPALPSGLGGHSVTALGDGGLVVAGGTSGGPARAETLVLSADGASWEPGPPLLTPREGHEAIPLPDGRVLMVGGREADGGASPLQDFWPSLSGWTLPSWFAPNPDAELLRLPTGDLFTSGQLLLDGGPSEARVLYLGFVLPGATTTSLRTPRADFAAVTLPDGKVLAIAGQGSGAVLDGVEAFDPGPQAWHVAGRVMEARARPGAVVLLSGELLVVGGASADGGLRSVERCFTGQLSCAPAPPLARARVAPHVLLLADGRVLVADDSTAATEVFDAEQNAWGPGPLLPFVGPHVALPLGDGSHFLGAVSEAWRLSADAGRLDQLPAPPRALETRVGVMVPSGDLQLAGGHVDGQPSELAHWYVAQPPGWVTGSLPRVLVDPLMLAFTTGQHSVLSGRLGGSTPVRDTYGIGLGTFAYDSTWLAAPHAEGAARWLLDGRGLVVGGRDETEAVTASAEYLEASLPPTPAERPVIDALPRDASPGEALLLRGRNLLPVGGGSSATNDDRAPSVMLRRLQDDLLRPVASRRLGPDTLEFNLPADLPWGHFAVTVTVRGASSVAAVVRVAAPLGAPCVKDWRCASWRCAAGVCAAAPGPDGGSGSDGGSPDAGLSDGGQPDGGAQAPPRALHVGCGCDALAAGPAVLLLLISVRRRRRIT